jgi:hypothetical protein
MLIGSFYIRKKKLQHVLDMTNAGHTQIIEENRRATTSMAGRKGGNREGSDATERRETMKNERNTKEKEGIQDIK